MVQTNLGRGFIRKKSDDDGREDRVINLYGSPDGPEQWYPIIGKTGTFTQQRKDMYTRFSSGQNTLMHHIPYKYRGSFYLSEGFVDEYNEWVDKLADEEITIPQHENGPPEVWLDQVREFGDFRVDQYGLLLCDGKTLAGEPCNNKAQHRTTYCGSHGGRLHPLDKTVTYSKEAAARAGRDSFLNDPAVQARMTRFQKFKLGLITVEDLDDEELARGQFKDSKGRFVGHPPQNIPREMHDSFISELFKRADMRLQEGLVECVNTMVEIATSPVYEAKDRIKAATWTYERIRGRTPDVVIHSQDKPWEHVLQAIQGGSREESRASRDRGFHDAFGDQPSPSNPGGTPNRATDPNTIDGETIAIANEGIEVDFEGHQDEGYDPDLDDEDVEAEDSGLGEAGEPGLGDSPAGFSPGVSKPWLLDADDYDDEGESAEDDEHRDARSTGGNSRTQPPRRATEKDSQYEYTSITVEGDDGEEYDKVVARPKKGSEAEAMRNEQRAHDKKRKRALKQLKAEQLRAMEASQDDQEDEDK